MMTKRVKHRWRSASAYPPPPLLPSLPNGSINVQLFATSESCRCENCKRCRNKWNRVELSLPPSPSSQGHGQRQDPRRAKAMPLEHVPAPGSERLRTYGRLERKCLTCLHAESNTMGVGGTCRGPLKEGRRKRACV